MQAPEPELPISPITPPPPIPADNTKPDTTILDPTIPSDDIKSDIALFFEENYVYFIIGAVSLLVIMIIVCLARRKCKKDRSYFDRAYSDVASQDAAYQNLMRGVTG